MQKGISNSSPTHDITNAEYHISNIQKLVEGLNAATKAVWPGRYGIRYTNVQVLLLSWEDDDLGVSAEIEPLERLFKERYYFDVEEYKIPSIRPESALTRRVLDLTDNYGKETLLIIYYGGHARPALQSSDGSLWVANRHSPIPVVPSSGIQSKLEQAASDVILILDCCFSATTPITGFQQNGKVMESLTACGYETTAAEADQHSFTKALTHVLAMASKGLPFTIGELHGRILSRLKCYARELEVVDGDYVDTANGQLRLEPQVRRTPIYSTLCETIPPRSIVLAPLRQMHTTTTMDSGEDIPEPSSADSSGPCNSSENGESHPRKRKRALEDDGKCPQILLAVRLTKSDIDCESLVEWIRNAPPEAKDIYVEGKYDSFSTLLLLRMPVSIWNLLPDNPAYSFVGFVTSENTAWDKIPICHCTDVCDECIKKLRAAKSLNRYQHRGQAMNFNQSTDNHSSPKGKRVREVDGDDSDADTPGSTGSSDTEVGERVQLPSPSPDFYDALRSDAMDEDVNAESFSRASKTIPAWETSFRSSSEEVASSLKALHISRGKRRAENSGDDDRRRTRIPMTPESELSDNSSIALPERGITRYLGGDFNRRTRVPMTPESEVPDNRSVSHPWHGDGRGFGDIYHNDPPIPMTLDTELRSVRPSAYVEKDKARNFSEFLPMDSTSPAILESEPPENRLVSDQESAEQLKKGSIEPGSSEPNNTLPALQFIGTSLLAFSGLTNIFGNITTTSRRQSPQQHGNQNFTNSPGPSKSSSHSRNQRRSQRHDISQKRVQSPPKTADRRKNERRELFWFCCQCGGGPCACGGVSDTCPDSFACSHTRCSDCTVEQHKVSETAQEHLDG